MKKTSKLLFALSCATLMALTPFASNSVRANGQNLRVLNATHSETSTPVGDLKGGMNFTYQATSTDFPSTIKVMTINKDFGTEGFYIRIRNNTGINTPINFFVNSTNGHRVQLKTNAPVETYSASGVKGTDIATREFGSYLMLPANFDGFVYIPLSSFESLSSDAWSGNSTTTMLWNSVYAMYLACSTQYDAYANYDIGDILTDDHVLLDTSSLSDDQAAEQFAKDYQGEYTTLNRLANSKDFSHEGDLNGGARLTYNHTDSDAYATTRFHGKNNNFGGDGLFIRMKNNTSTLTYITLFVNGTNGHRVAPIANETFYTYDVNKENKQAQKYREFGHYISLPASFDGYVYLPYSSFASLSVSEWAGNNGTSMDYSSVFALYFTMSTFYDSFADYTIGDVFTNDNVLFDGSEVTKEEFGNYFVNDDPNNPTIITQQDGFKKSEVAFDYSTVNYVGEYDRGAKISFTAPETDISVGVNITPTIKDYSSANAFVFRIKNLNGDYPFGFNVVDENGKTKSLGGKNVGGVYFMTTDNKLILNTWGGNPKTTKIPYPLDGWCVIPLTSLEGDDIDLAHINHFEINVAAFYDFNFTNVFGDCGYSKEDKSMVITLDVSTLDKNGFSAAFTKGSNPEYSKIALYETAKPSQWIGDVKIIDSLNYASTEELKENVTWDPGDNACSYEKMEDGMKVDIGPYETGHQYGDYMCLGMFNKGRTTDRTVWNKDKDNNDRNALGITMYLKNLSKREIGINLQFDENGATQERWIVKGYPAMYYAYDVIKDADYIFYAKGDQIQIPVGFEGYVRIPFTSYQVPDWCHGEGFSGTDDVLDISKASGNFFLTSNNTKYEDLSFFIKNVGIYYNETTAGSLFNNENTIKANMGLGD